MASNKSYIVLNDGHKLPCVGLGTYLGWNLGPEIRDLLTTAVEAAIDAGYRHIDTATIYENEELVGKAIQNKITSGAVKREDLFITTKLWVDSYQPEQVENALNTSLEKLGLQYVDLYLIHWPNAYTKDGSEDHVDYVVTWKAMEAIREKGLAKSIGVSNFNIPQLERLLKNATVKPAALQIEVHLSLTQEPLVKFAQDNGIAVTAYSPLGYLATSRTSADPETPAPAPNDPVLTGIAKKYKKTVSQIALKYLMERGMAVIPKSTDPNRQKSNLDLFDFDLTAEEVKALGQFNSNSRIVLPAFWQDHPNYPFENTGKPTPPNIFAKKEGLKH